MCECLVSLKHTAQIWTYSTFGLRGANILTACAFSCILSLMCKFRITLLYLVCKILRVKWHRWLACWCECLSHLIIFLLCVRIRSQVLSKFILKIKNCARLIDVRVRWNPGELWGSHWRLFSLKCSKGIGIWEELRVQSRQWTYKLLSRNPLIVLLAVWGDRRLCNRKGIKSAHED